MSNRKERTRRRIKEKSQRPRLSVFVSNKHIYAQIIDDQKRQTLVAARDSDLPALPVRQAGGRQGLVGGKTAETAKKVGELLGKRAKEEKIKEVVFDRGKYKYHGKVKALAEGARAAGLEF